MDTEETFVVNASILTCKTVRSFPWRYSLGKEGYYWHNWLVSDWVHYQGVTVFLGVDLGIIRLFASDCSAFTLSSQLLFSNWVYVIVKQTVEFLLNSVIMTFCLLFCTVLFCIFYIDAIVFSRY